MSWLALDKTGTITHGKPVQTHFEALADTDINRCQQLRPASPDARIIPCRKRSRVQLPRATSPPYPSLNSRRCPDAACKGQSTANLTGSAIIVWSKSSAIAPRRSKPGSTRWNAMENVVLLMDAEQGVLALFAVADTIKQSSRAAIADLHALGVHIHAVRDCN